MKMKKCKFLLQNFMADFVQFSSANANFLFIEGRLGTGLRGFFEIFLFSKI